MKILNLFGTTNQERKFVTLSKRKGTSKINISKIEMKEEQCFNFFEFFFSFYKKQKDDPEASWKVLWCNVFSDISWCKHHQALLVYNTGNWHLYKI